MKAFICASRALSSGARKIDDGCTVAMTWGASGDSINLPRSRVTRKSFANKACAALAPRQTNTSGRTSSNSAYSQGRHA